MSRGVKEHPKVEKLRTSWFVRKDAEGQPIPLVAWQKVTIALGSAVMAWTLVPRIWYYLYPINVEKLDSEEKRKQDLVKKRSLYIPVMASGKSFLDSEDGSVFEGLTPREINELAKTKLGGTGSGGDPFEGLSPEEIDALFDNNTSSGER
ncbi:hypothetical protein CEUSTIGMA_g11644.t1 [Chlamydomonas eustigma]|uniref:Uncharacterized protein n=1 Tax=Chlamydomonas eustigma TaxID=1157962 RepID=A0A250XM91_9CHLO|nr:hypothetical protein CEUSTIGMA_g11644.t1 [Chlamydomonas eustigma]|eukprot:GAX84221.1 hypothetical protein CEUSTIGMA_g11644.t1 [Chlamydomonas eustigma]